MSEYPVHTIRPATKFEWIGLAIVKRYIARTMPGIRLQDVHTDHSFFDKGIDFILHDQNRRIGIDVKVDSYYGLDRERKVRGMYHPDSGCLLLETISQLKYERTGQVGPNRNSAPSSDVPGWFFTSQADEVYYYYLALLNDTAELDDVYDRYRNSAKKLEDVSGLDEEVMKIVKVERDLLVSFRLAQVRDWYVTAPPVAFSGYAAAPNPTYVTVSRRVSREYFLSKQLGQSHGSIFSNIA